MGVIVPFQEKIRNVMYRAGVAMLPALFLPIFPLINPLRLEDPSLPSFALPQPPTLYNRV